LARIGRVRENCHATRVGESLFDYLQTLADFHAGVEGQTGDVAARTRESGDEPEPNRIANTDHDDGDRPGGFLGGHGSRRRRRCHNVHLEPNQVGREVGQPVEATLGKSILDDDVLAFCPSELAKPLPERLNIGTGGRAGPEKPHPGDLPCRLRYGGTRRGQKDEGSRQGNAYDHLTWRNRRSGASSIIALAT
jgi:hypothetical protein